MLGGQVEPGAEVLVYDDHGDHQGPSVVDFLATRGSKVELATPDRMTAHEVGADQLPRVPGELLLEGGQDDPGTVACAAWSATATGCERPCATSTTTRTSRATVDQVVVEHGTLPAAEIFHELAPLARNEGELDIEALIAGRAQAIASNEEGGFMLFRVGDAVASRNIHAAIYDSLRLCKEF